MNLSELFIIFIMRFLECTFVILEKLVDVVLCKLFFKKSSTRSSTIHASLINNTEDKKTVIIVGGSFAGLSALQELKGHNKKYRIILIDQKNYFEYTPGVLRLFCDPTHFTNITRKLSYRNDDVLILHGKVTEVATNSVSYIPYREDHTTTINFDYLIMATGSTHSYPITASTTTSTTDEKQKTKFVVEEECTIQSREEGWMEAYKKVKSSQRILILGAGAVGTELAAEIIDYFPTKHVILVDASPNVVPLFPKATQDYATTWLLQKGVELKLGRSLETWDENSCKFQDGTTLEADIVYVCFGGKPNSSPAMTLASNSLNRRKNILVDEYLRVNASSTTTTGNIFACGDVASPPTEALAQGFHAEIQGIVAARNIIASSSSEKMIQYPNDICGSNRMPLVYVLSLGRYDGVLGFNAITLKGSIAAIFKFILEYTKVLQMEGRTLGLLIWKFGDAAALFLSRTLIKPPTSSSS